MLPKAARLTRSAEFTAAVRGGRRCGRSTLVVHLLEGASPGQSRAGFVVGKSVGGAVVRNTVSRRLRALVRDRLAAVPAGSSLVVRALPGAAHASSAMLASDLDRCLQRLGVVAVSGAAT